MGQWGFPSNGMAAGGGGVAPMALPKEIVRIGEQALWSTYKWLDATALANQDYIVFSTPLGQPGQGFTGSLTRAETNLRESSRIPSGYAYNVNGIAIQPYALTGTSANTLYPVVGADMRNIFANLVLQWYFLETYIDVAPVSLIGQGGGIFGIGADTGAQDGTGGTRIALNNGNGQLWVYTTFPVILPANATYNMVFKWGSSAIPVDGGSDGYALCLRAMLLGTYQSAVPAA